MKWYLGVRSTDGAEVRVVDGQVDLPAQGAYEIFPELAERQDLVNHSPTGLEWGYNGSGPAQCALAVLADTTGDDALALALYQDFKDSVIARLPAPDRMEPEATRRLEWFMPSVYVEAWLQFHPADPDRLERIREWRSVSAKRL